MARRKVASKGLRSPKIPDSSTSRKIRTGVGVSSLTGCRLGVGTLSLEMRDLAGLGWTRSSSGFSEVAGSIVTVSVGGDDFFRDEVGEEDIPEPSQVNDTHCLRIYLVKVNKGGRNKISRNHETFGVSTTDHRPLYRDLCCRQTFI